MSPIVTAALLTVGVVFFLVTMFWRVRVLAALKGVPGHRLDDAPARAEALVKFGLGQRRMVDREELLPGLMHLAIFGAFGVLAIRTVMLFVMGFSDTALHVLTNPADPFWADRQGLLRAYEIYLL